MIPKCAILQSVFILSAWLNVLFLTISAVLKCAFLKSVSCYTRDCKVKSQGLLSHKYKNISGVLSLKSLEFSRDSFYK